MTYVRLVVLALALAAPLAANAASKKGPKVFTNESIVNAWTDDARLDLDNIKSVLSYVLSQLPDEVTVYPTENYYYFYFYQDGVRYAGNLRLDTEMARKGELVFAYFRASTPWAQDQKDYGRVFKKEDGVEVTAAGPLAYNVSFGGRTVLFRFNDLSGVKPAQGTLKEGEKYLGPVFDESGIRFFLVFDETRKLFHYILDETVRVNDKLAVPKNLKNTVVGWRTGFAFFVENEPSRKVLIAVHRSNADANNYYDGPFDQLPDNFLKGNELRDALVAVDPELEGKIDRFGNIIGTMERELIAPYVEYDLMQDLELAEACAREEPGKTVAACMEERFPAEE